MPASWIKLFFGLQLFPMPRVPLSSFNLEFNLVHLARSKHGYFIIHFRRVNEPVRVFSNHSPKALHFQRSQEKPTWRVYLPDLCIEKVLWSQWQENLSAPVIPATLEVELRVANIVQANDGIIAGEKCLAERSMKDRPVMLMKDVDGLG